MNVLSEMLSYPFMVRALFGGMLVSLCYGRADPTDADGRWHALLRMSIFPDGVSGRGLYGTRYRL